MGIIGVLPQIIEDAKSEYDRLLTTDACCGSDFCSADEPHNNSDLQDRLAMGFDGCGKAGEGGGTLYHGDNLELLTRGLRSGQLRERLNLIYCDPPFFSHTDQGVRIPVHSELCPDIKALRVIAYGDTWKGDLGGYLRYLTVRLMLMRDALREDGSIFIHLDWHAVHAVKLIMDEVFGEENFVNEIIWTYKSGGAAKRHFSKKHDTILFYSKSKHYRFFPSKEKSYNRDFKPYRFKGVEEFQDQVGWYTLVNKKDVWQIDMVGRSSGERVNYATQKPETLIRDIISAVTKPGDLCADFFCGSGTLPVCAAKMGRYFLASDVSGLAISKTVKRLLEMESDTLAGFALVDDQGHRLEMGKTANTGIAGKGQGLCSGKTGKSAAVITGKAVSSQSGSLLWEYPCQCRLEKRCREDAEALEGKDPAALRDYACVAVTRENSQAASLTNTGVRVEFDIFGSYKVILPHEKSGE